MTDKKTQTVEKISNDVTSPFEDEVSQIEKLEMQVLGLRRLHANALQMLVTMGRNLLQNQQTLLNAVSEMRERYAELATFLDENSAHLPDPPAEKPDESEE